MPSNGYTNIDPMISNIWMFENFKNIVFIGILIILIGSAFLNKGIKRKNKVFIVIGTLWMTLFFIFLIVISILRNWI